MDRDAGHGQRLRHPGRLLASQPAYARTTFLNAAPAALRPPGLGFRVVRDP
jgi:sulfatase modifying factor 1